MACTRNIQGGYLQPGGRVSHRGVGDLAVASVVLLRGPDNDDDTHFPLCELGSGQKR